MGISSCSCHLYDADRPDALHDFRQPVVVSIPGGTRSTGDTIRFAKYVIRGRVLEENGQPVQRAVIRIGGELVLTDSEGRFFIRTKKSTPCPVEVATGEFLGPGYFEVSSAPSSIVPATDERTPTITIRVRRAPLSLTVETSERR